MNLKEAQQKINEIKIQQMQIDEKDLDMWNDYQRQIETIQKETIMTPWDHVELARRPDRPKAQDYIDLLFDEFIELLLRNEPLLRVPVIEEQKKKWYDPIEKLRERGYTEADILNTMRYALTSNFWKAHILTPEKFKIKFSQLLLKYRSEQTQQAKPSFNNFTGRQYDMEQLEMELLQTGTSTKV